MSRWEHGSDFHLLEASGGNRLPAPWGGDAIALGSGRGALLLLIRHGRATRGWRRLWLPSYFCQDVVALLAEEEILLASYPDAPGQLPQIDPRAFSPGDALLLVNYFGLRSESPVDQLPGFVDVVEDHTHDPWSAWARSSRADWCMASLRKVLPIPDGAVLWSPRDHPLPPPPPLTMVHRAAAADRLEAMRLKRRYLAGDDIPKEIFRSLAVRGEGAFATADPSAMTDESARLLDSFPTASWREARIRNHGALCDELRGIEHVTLLSDGAADGAAPLAMIVALASRADRDAVRQRLVEQRVYPAILWPLEDSPLGPPPYQHLELSGRVLALHCDGRYGAEDLERVAATLRRCVAVRRVGVGAMA